jgi:17beta-estradiol 17-dehydrogenase / very-long-chain 3-oxoacyl-CoA reductase
MFETYRTRLEPFISSGSSRSLTYSPVLLLTGVGALFALSFVYKIVFLLLDLYVLPGTPLTKYGGGRSTSTTRPKAWALVTGASDGIGREFALQLSRAGFSIILASRSADKLAKVAAEIKSANASAETKVVSIDFSSGDQKQYDELEAAISGLSIGVLVNNVGKSHDIPVPFAETTMEEMLSISEINVNATLRVTRMVVPGMVKQ